MKKYFLFLILLFTSFISITMHTFATQDPQDPVVSKEIIRNYFYQCGIKNKENKKNKKEIFFKKYFSCTKPKEYLTCGIIYSSEINDIHIKEPIKNGKYTVIECTVKGKKEELEKSDETFLDNEKKVIIIDKFTKYYKPTYNNRGETFSIDFRTVVSNKELSDILENNSFTDE